MKIGGEKEKIAHNNKDMFDLNDPCSTATPEFLNGIEEAIKIQKQEFGGNDFEYDQNLEKLLGDVETLAHSCGNKKAKVTEIIAGNVPFEKMMYVRSGSKPIDFEAIF